MLSVVRSILSKTRNGVTEIPWERIAKKDKDVATLLREGFEFIVNARIATKPIILGNRYYGFIRELDDTTSEFAIKKKELINKHGAENVHVSLAYDVNGNPFDRARGLWIRQHKDV